MRHPLARPSRPRLTQAQLLAVEEMVKNGSGLDKTARAAGVSKNTIKNWIVTPMFSAAVNERQKEMEDTVWRRLRSATEAAADALISVTESTTEKGSVRVMAANSILDRTSFKQAEKVELTTNPYETREELVAALASIPADVLAEAVKRSSGN